MKIRNPDLSPKRLGIRLVRRRQTKEPATDRLHLNHRVTSRLYPRSDWPASQNARHPMLHGSSTPPLSIASLELNSFDFIERNLILRPIIKLRRRGD
jgi:hypothetical protein